MKFFFSDFINLLLESGKSSIKNILFRSNNNGYMSSSSDDEEDSNKSFKIIFFAYISTLLKQIVFFFFGSNNKNSGFNSAALSTLWLNWGGFMAKLLEKIMLVICKMNFFFFQKRTKKKKNWQTGKIKAKFMPAKEITIR